MPPTEVREGDVVRIPANTPQRITNTDVEDLTFYCICCPISERIVTSRLPVWRRMSTAAHHDGDAVTGLIVGEMTGKNAAIHAYDRMIWTVRTGFLTLLFGAWGLLISSISNDLADAELVASGGNAQPFAGPRELVAS